MCFCVFINGNPVEIGAGKNGNEYLKMPEFQKNSSCEAACLAKCLLMDLGSWHGEGAAPVFGTNLRKQEGYYVYPTYPLKETRAVDLYQGACCATHLMLQKLNKPYQ